MRAHMRLHQENEVEVHLYGREALRAKTDDESNVAAVEITGALGGPTITVFCDDHAYAQRIAAAINACTGSAPEDLHMQVMRELQEEMER